MGLHEMERKIHYETNIINGDDEDFIDMEVSSSTSSSSSSTSSFISFTANSPPRSREFEFQMCSAAAAASGEPTTSPADELFYKGKLLPLHLPPRLQMVQKLLETSAAEPSATAAAATTPLEPRAVSPCESRRLSSGEIVNPDEKFFEISSELKNLIDSEHSRSTLNKKIKQIKQSSLTQKLKASRAYIMGLFTRPGCSISEINPKSRIEGAARYSKSPRKNPFGKIESVDEFSIVRGNSNDNKIHRKSFSGVIQRHCPARCLSYSGSNSSGSSSSSSSSSLSSSFSFGSNGSLDLQILCRNSSAASSEIDNSIEGAIAHCKQSISPRKSNVSESELGSSRTSSVSGERERAEISRI